MNDSPREACLRPEAAALYPKLVPARWVHASDLVPVALRERERNGFPWDGLGRALLEEHFVFRGGRPRGRPPALGTRVEDA